MTSTPCPSAAKIAAFFAIIVETIVTIAKNIRNTLHEFGACCRKIGRRLALCPGLSRPMMPKLGFLPPSVSARHSFARKRSPELDDAVRCVLIADIGAALARPSVRVGVQKPANLVAAIGDAEEELMDLEDPEAMDIERILEARGMHVPT